MELLSREDFVKKYASLVNQLTQGTGIFPQTLFAMAIVESQGKASNGNYYVGLNPIARIYNNYFGIHKGVGWKGRTVEAMDNGKLVEFRVYSSFEDSVKDYINFLKKNTRYKKAFTAPTYPAQIIEIARAGYSETGNYSEVITSIAKKVDTYFFKYVKKYKKHIAIGLPLLLLFIAGTAYYIDKNKKHEQTN